MDSGDSQAVFKLSKSLGYQIRKYREDEKEAPLLLLAFGDENDSIGFEGSEGNERGFDGAGVGQHVAFCQFDEDGLAKLEFVLPTGLLVSGLVVFDEYEFEKCDEIKKAVSEAFEGSGLARKVANGFFGKSQNCVFYDFDEDLFYNIEAEGEDGGKHYYHQAKN